MAKEKEPILQPLRGIRIEMPFNEEGLKDYSPQDFKKNNAILASLKYPNYNSETFELVFNDFDKDYVRIYFIVLVFWFDSPLSGYDYNHRVETAAKLVGWSKSDAAYEDNIMLNNTKAADDAVRFLDAQEFLSYKSLSLHFAHHFKMHRKLLEMIGDPEKEKFQSQVVNWKDSLMEGEIKLMEYEKMLREKASQDKNQKREIREKSHTFDRTGSRPREV